MRHALPAAAVAVVIIGATLAFAVSLRPRVSTGNAAQQASPASPAGIPAASNPGRSPYRR